jgi:hypothetical protein
MNLSHALMFFINRHQEAAREDHRAPDQKTGGELFAKKDD